MSLPVANEASSRSAGVWRGEFTTKHSDARSCASDKAQESISHNSTVRTADSRLPASCG